MGTTLSQKVRKYSELDGHMSKEYRTKTKKFVMVKKGKKLSKKLINKTLLDYNHSINKNEQVHKIRINK